MGSGFGRDIIVGRLIVAIGESSREIEQRVAESSISNKVKRVCLRATCVRACGREGTRGRERISLEQLDLFPASDYFCGSLQQKYQKRL